VTARAAGSLVVDANVVIAISAKEVGRASKAQEEINAFASVGYLLYAPGVFVAETQFALCRKFADGQLSAADYSRPLANFEMLAPAILPPPAGDVSLISRAQAISSGYGCSRSADALYIALAESLAATLPTVLLTFDADLPKQAASHAPTLTVKLLYS